jgi:hypothetical protein
MPLWILWYQTVAALRPACARPRTFLWLLVVLAAMTVRTDLAGVTSLARSHWLRPHCYHRLLYFFHSPALNLAKLFRTWTALVVRLYIANNDATTQGGLVSDADRKPAEAYAGLFRAFLRHERWDDETRRLLLEVRVLERGGRPLRRLLS